MTIKDRNSRIAFNTIALYIRTFIVMVISFITARVMLQQLGVDDYGLNNLISGVVTMFNFLNMSMGTAVQRFYSVEEAKENGVSAKKIFGSAMLIHLAISAVTLILLEVFAIFFLQWVFQFTSINLILGIITVPPTAYLRAKEEFSKLVVLDIVEAFCRLGILYLLYVSPVDKLWTLAFLTFVVTVLYNLVIWLIANRNYQEVTRPYVYYEKGLFRQMMSFSLLLLFAVTSSMVYWQGLVMMINIFFGVAINAAYGIGNPIKTAVDRFLSNFKQSIVSQLMESQAAGEDARLYKLIYASTKITFVLSLLIAVPVIFETDFILKVWLKTPPEFTTRFVQLGFAVSVLNSFSFFVTQAIHATGKVKGYSLMTSFGYLVGLIVVYVMMRLGYSFYVTMYVSIVLAVVEIVITCFYAKRTFDFRVSEFLAKVVLRSLFFCAIMVGCFVLMNHFMDEGWLRFCMNVLLSGVISLASLYILMNKAERDYVMSFLKKIFVR